MSKRKTLEEFISEATEKHEGKYSYDAITQEIWESSGSNRTKKVPIICPKHGIFWQAISNHLNKGSSGRFHGCPKCARENIEQQHNPRNTNKKNYGRKSTGQFITEAINIHGDRYNYDQVEYVTAKSPVKIRCNICGNMFEQTPDHHINRKDGCPYCRNSKFSETQQYPKEKAEKLITEAIKEDRFEILEYHGFRSNALMRCKKCGFVFQRMPLTAQRLKCQCPNCDNMPKGESIVLKTLENLGINYVYQYRTEWLGTQSLDFYLPKFNIGIEFDGKQHYEPVSVFGGEDGFKIQHERDVRKNKLCEENGVKLIRIPYWKINDVDDVLNETLTSYIMLR